MLRRPVETAEAKRTRPPSAAAAAFGPERPRLPSAVESVIGGITAAGSLTRRRVRREVADIEHSFQLQQHGLPVLESGLFWIKIVGCSGGELAAINDLGQIVGSYE